VRSIIDKNAAPAPSSTNNATEQGQAPPSRQEPHSAFRRTVDDDTASAATPLTTGRDRDPALPPDSLLDHLNDDMQRMVVLAWRWIQQ
jgi:hypothetical protein